MKKNKIRYLSLGSRLVLLFSGAMLSGMVLLGAVLSLTMYKNIQNSTYENIELSVNTTSDSIEQSLVLVRNTTLELAASNAVTYWLRDADYYKEEHEDFFLRREELKADIQKIISYSNARKLNMISFATVFAEDQLLEYTYVKQISIGTIERESRQAYEIIMENDDEYVYSFPIDSQNNKVFHIRKLKSDFDSQSQLVLLVAINEKDIRSKYEELVKDIGDVVLLVDEKRVVYSSNQDEVIGKTIELEVYEQIRDHNQGEIQYEGINYYVTYKNIKETGDTFVYLYPKDKITEQVIVGMRPYFGITVLIVTVFLCLGIAMSRKSTRFIDEFVHAMRSVREKNYDVKIRTYNDPEIDTLGNTFNEMTTEIKDLIQNKYESQLLLSEMEISFLQHQMNPHFLFNVLLTIQIKAKRYPDQTVFKMTSALAALLRASIYTDKQSMITVRQELEYVEFYLYLQEMRFVDKLTYQIIVGDESVLDCRIPKFIVEPLVENAVIHGVEFVESDAVITIDIVREVDIYIYVRDNGIGFDAESYMKNRMHESEGEPGRQDKVGLNNVNLRLKHIYGEEYGLTVRSRINEGTEIVIRIPFLGGEEDV